MKERPILFTPENAQKCHDGRKTQTRRIVKDYEFYACLTGDCPHWDKKLCAEAMAKECPYGQVGDRLWVREATALWREGWDRTGHVIYKGGMVDKDGEYFSDDDLMGLSKWTPSIHMPRAACRTVLEIIEVRVERVQDCSEADAIAEGIEHHNGGEIGHSGYRHDRSHGYVYATAQEAYKVLWESINGAGSWALNPWVWVLTFKRVDG